MPVRGVCLPGDAGDGGAGGQEARPIQEEGKALACSMQNDGMSACKDGIPASF